MLARPLTDRDRERDSPYLMHYNTSSTNTKFVELKVTRFECDKIECAKKVWDCFRVQRSLFTAGRKLAGGLRILFHQGSYKDKFRRGFLIFLTSGSV